MSNPWPVLGQPNIPWPVSAYRHYPDGPPWPPDWESGEKMDDPSHQHDWVHVAVETRPRSWEQVSWCAECRAPRCDRRGCMERRHHPGVHKFGDGLWFPIGSSPE